MDGQLTLHDARVRRNLGLGELQARTLLSLAVLQKIDEGRFEELPPGLYARAYVRSFAAEVGLDPGEALRTVEHLLPGAPDPLPVMRELKGPGFSDRLASIVARVTKREEAAPVLRNDDVQSNDTITTEIAPYLPASLTRVGAAAIDALVLIGMNAMVVLVVALGAGLSPTLLVRHGSGALGALCAVPTVLYFILFNGIGGRTFGRWLCRLPEPALRAPLTLDAILRRSITLGSSFDTRRDDLSRPALVSRGS